MSMVKSIKLLLKKHKVYITIWLYLNGIPFDVSNSPEFWATHENRYNSYTSLSRDTFYNNVAHYYWRFAIVCA